MSDAGAQSATDLVEAGRTLHRQGRIEEAEQLYAQALAADEFCADAHQLMAVIAGQRGKFDEAIVGFRRTIALEGPTGDRLYNLAEAYRATEDFQAALDAYNQAIAIDASLLDVYRNCAAMIKHMAERSQSSGEIQSAQQLRRLAAHYLLGLGHACLRATRVDSAEEAYREAVALDAGNAEAYNCLGTIALEASRPVEAEMYHRRAHEIEPASPLFLSNLGRALLSELRLDEALRLFRRAIEIDPSFDEARVNLEERFLPWLHYRSDFSPSAVFAAHRDWASKEVARVEPKVGELSNFRNSRDPERPLRVAYLGLDLGSQLTKSCIGPLLANHDRRAFNIVIYANVAGGVADVRDFRKLGLNFRVTGHGSPELAKKLREEGIDILIDVAGHAAHNRVDVLALKPAPVVATWLGYPDTTGLPTVDYRITDEISDPREAEQFHSEQLFRLGQGSLIYRPPQDAPNVGVLPARVPGGVTFGNFDDPRKISPEIMETWSVILRSLPGSRIRLVAPEFADSSFAARLHSLFQKAGINGARLDLRVAPSERKQVLSAYGEIDIGLDTAPYNADRATICDSLWMGVPVMTLSGDRSCGRTSTSILSQVGLERLDSHSGQEYAETVVELAQDLDRLRTLRSGMRERMRVSPLMDERNFAARFEAALRDMWRDWCMRGD